MFRIVGPKAKDLCDAHLRPSRRDILRVGGTGMLGLSLGSLLKLKSIQAAGAATPTRPSRWRDPLPQELRATRRTKLRTISRFFQGAPLEEFEDTDGHW